MNEQCYFSLSELPSFNRLFIQQVFWGICYWQRCVSFEIKINSPCPQGAHR